MKKLLVALLVAVVGMPVVAQEVKNVPGNPPAVEMQRDHEAFQKAREQQRAQFKATKEKMENLVKQYQKAKGKKKQAAREQIAQEVASIRDKQMEFRQEQLAQFEERLARMKAEFEQENTAEKKAQWVEQKTDALIAADGDVKALFPRPEGMHRPHRDFGPKGPGMRGPKPQAPDMDD